LRVVREGKGYNRFQGWGAKKRPKAKGREAQDALDDAWGPSGGDNAHGVVAGKAAGEWAGIEAVAGGSTALRSEPNSS
jgi:hypothetical protein